jgi:hypothetical protein
MTTYQFLQVRFTYDQILMHDNLVNISTAEIKFIPLESSRQEESNGIKFIKIRSVEPELFTDIAKKSLHNEHIKFSKFAYYRGTFENFLILHTHVFKRSTD